MKKNADKIQKEVEKKPKKNQKLKTHPKDEKCQKEEQIHKSKPKKINHDKILIKKQIEEIEKLQEQVINLRKSNYDYEKEIKKNINDFQSKAKKFASEAKIQLEAKEKEIAFKYEKENQKIKKFANQNFANDLFNQILNIELAVNANNDNEIIKSYVLGFKMIVSQIFGIFNDYNFEIIAPKIGDNFNPEMHHVIEKSKKSHNKIIKVVRKGLRLYDRVLIPAKVAI